MPSANAWWSIQAVDPVLRLAHDGALAWSDPTYIVAIGSTTWGSTVSGVYSPDAGKTWSPMQVRADRNDGRAHLVFREIVGKAEVWVDGVKLGEKTSFEPGPLSVPVAKGANWRTMTLLLQSEPGKASGVIGTVQVEPGAP